MTDKRDICGCIFGCGHRTRHGYGHQTRHGYRHH